MNGRFWRILLLFLSCVLISFSVKTCTYNREAVSMALNVGDAKPLWDGTLTRDGKPAAAGLRDFLPTPRPNFMPYTIESAMMFCYASDIAKGKSVPEHDPRLAYLKEIAPYAQMNMALEWVLGWGYRALSLVRTPPEPTANQLRFQDSPDFAWFVSVNVRLWTSLISGQIFLWLVLLRVPLPLAFAGGVLHAVSAAAVARATGQDIVRGDFCIPLIVASMVIGLWILRKPDRFKPVLLFAVSFLAFAAWDLSRLLFASWGLFEILRFLCGGRPTGPRRTVWTVITAAAVLNALVVPFNVAYKFITSDFLCVLLPVLMLTVWLPWIKLFRRRLGILLAAALVLTGFYKAAIDNPEYRSNYSHFSAVMASKIKFYNTLPADPSKMDYDSRVMWTPSMHSLTPEISATFFPTLGSLPGTAMTSGLPAVQNLWNFFPLTAGFFALLLFIGGLFTPTRTAILRDLPRSAMPYLFTFGFAAGYIFIVRYHEFVILFLSLSLPLAVQEYRHALGKCRKLRWIAPCIFRMLIVFELFVTTCGRVREYKTSDMYIPNTASLIEWFRAERSMEGKTVVTLFTLGPMLMAYCGANIVMQPQFGMEPIRRPVEEYFNVMYHGTEKDLLKFCDKYDADYLVFDIGMAGPMVPYSSRYIANAEKIESQCPVNLMMRAPERLRHFYLIRAPEKYRMANTKYRLFKVILTKDRERAEVLAGEASEAMLADDLSKARTLIDEAFRLDPVSLKVRSLYRALFGSVPKL